jgi:Fe-S cluster assembly protein SufD
MSVNTERIFDRQVVTQLSQSQQEPTWMLKNRLQALEAAPGLRLPKLEKTRIDNWNFTDVEPVKPEPPISSVDQFPDEIRQFVSVDGEDSLLIQKNASPVYAQLPESLAEQGVVFTDLATALTKHPALVQSYFMTDGIKPDEHRLAALHAALWSGGAFLYLPKNVEVTVPFQVLFWANGKGIGTFPHLLIVADVHSKGHVVANFVSDDETDAVVNSMVEVFAGDGSNLTLASLHTHGARTTDVSYRRTMVGKGARLDWIVGDLNAGDTVSDNTTHMKGSGGHAQIKAITVGSGKQRSNITAAVRHWGSHTESDITARGVMKDQAQTILNGITKIEKGAKKANGVQAEKVLMLNREARGDANPILLIDENDVKAGHAASVGRIDPLQMFYLMSRGLSKQEAERLIIFGFVGPVLDSIPFESLKERIVRVIERKLT